MAHKVQLYLKDHDTAGLDIRIFSPCQAMRATLQRVRAGQDSISVTATFCTTFLTDLFPILELGTSAKMLSIVPLLAPVEDSTNRRRRIQRPSMCSSFSNKDICAGTPLGEFLALQVSIEDESRKTQNPRGLVVAKDAQSGRRQPLKEGDKTLLRAEVGELDNRGSHFLSGVVLGGSRSPNNPMTRNCRQSSAV